MNSSISTAVKSEGVGNSNLSVRRSNIEMRSGMGFIWYEFYNLPPDSKVVRRSDLGFNESFTDSLSDEECERLTRESREDMERQCREMFG